MLWYGIVWIDMVENNEDEYDVYEYGNGTVQYMV